jgi:uncharacterized repeat protein (TIGR03803 family)
VQATASGRALIPAFITGKEKTLVPLRITFTRSSTVLALVLIVGLIPARAQQELILFNFVPGGHGENPNQGVVFDAAGNLYGVLPNGGRFGMGMVFELVPQLGGKWKERQIYGFRDSAGVDVCLTFDKSGNLYTTASRGGSYDVGTVLELFPRDTGLWTAKVLHTFNNNGTDGYDPGSCLTFDTDGNLYGATVRGGTYDFGTAFELTPTAKGEWKESILHNFNDADSDNAYPNGGLIVDRLGNVYGTTYGGTSNGSVFELSPTTGGTGRRLFYTSSEMTVWTEHYLWQA